MADNTLFEYEYYTCEPENTEPYTLDSSIQQLPFLIQDEQPQTSTSGEVASSSKKGKSKNRMGQSARIVKPTDKHYGIYPDELQCPVCSSIAECYRVLPCGHSICYQCFRTMIQSYYAATKLENTHATFNCPCCNFRIEHPLKAKIPFNLVLNSLMKRLLD